MIDLLLEKRAKFRYATCDIIKANLCCIQNFPRTMLRKYLWGRPVMNFQLGLELINKDLDAGKIIQKLRQLNYFMKMYLDIDQRKLLKLRSSKLITSDLDEKFSPLLFDKVRNDKKMLNMFVENMRQKKIEKKDIKLLQITGLQEMVEILKARELYRQ